MKVKLDEGAYMPTRAHETDAGLDLYAKERQSIMPQSSAVFDTGVHVELPKGTAGLLVSKSGLNTSYSITSTGLIDCGYTGAIKVKLYNHGKHPYMVEAGDKISQLVIVRYLDEKLEQVDELQDTPRGDKGFGSSGK